MSVAVEQPTPELDPAATPDAAQKELITEIADNDNSGIGAFGWTVRLAKMLLSAVISIAAVAAFWQLFLTLTKVDPFIGRGPADVFEYVFVGPEAAANRAVLIDASIITLVNPSSIHSLHNSNVSPWSRCTAIGMLDRLTAASMSFFR